MRNSIYKFLLCSLGFLYLIGDVLAEPPTPADLSSQLKSLQETVAALSELVKTQQEEITLLKSTKSSESGLANSSPVSSALAGRPPAVSSAPTQSSGLNFLPEIGVIGDIVGTLSESSEDEEGNDRFSVRELEIVFGHDVDPWTRFDATVAFSDAEDPALEEAYLTYFGLPAGFKMRLGAIRPKIGVASPLHRDSLDTVDEPLVVSQFFGEEGYARTGLELSNFLPLPSETLTSEAIFGIVQGGVEGGNLFGETERRPTIYARLRNSLEISDESSFDLGATVLAGSSDEDSGFESKAYGVDLTFTNYITPTMKLKLLSELYLQDRDTGFFDAESELPSDDSLFEDNPLGYYFLADFRFAERWALGARWDYVEAVNLSDDLVEDHETALSAYLSFFQSEFARWRFQYQHLEMYDGEADNRFFLQATVGIGVHKHPLQ